MPLSPDDEARLAPMVLHGDLIADQSRNDLREFRKYLVDTGTAKCLVKLYEHIVRNEMRLDNPHILKEFLASYQDGQPSEADEPEALLHENDLLRQRNEQLEVQVKGLTQELHEKQRLGVARKLWRLLVAPEFWEGTGMDPGGSGLTLQLLYIRLCGKQVIEPSTGQPLTQLVRPRLLTCAPAKVPLPEETFFDWLAFRAPEDVHSWCQDGLFPRMAALPKTESPFEAELVEAIRNSGVYPDDLKVVPDVVFLNADLRSFLQSIAGDFGCKLMGRNAMNRSTSRKR